jgi:cyclic pyranopterin phosphate synthase
MKRLRSGELHSPKGPIFQTAVVAGTMAAKRTSDLLPLCHPLPVEGCAFTIRAKGRRITIEARVRTTHKTGVEMEALTAVAVAALTVYDMGKAVSHGIVIRDIRLVKKTGGKSDYRGR